MPAESTASRPPKLPPPSIRSWGRIIQPLTPYRDIKFSSEDNVNWYMAVMPPHEIVIRLLRPVKVVGKFPKNGGIVASAHGHFSDVPLIYHVAATEAKQPIRLLTKRSLVDPSYEDSKKAQARRDGEKPGSLLKAVLRRPFVRKLSAAFLRAFRPIPVEITQRVSATNLKAFREVGRELNRGGIVGIFPTASRTATYDLLDIQPGLAALMQLHPDAPVYTASVSYNDRPLFRSLGQPVIVRVDGPFTLADVGPLPEGKGDDCKRQRTQIINDFIADRIGNTTDDPLRHPAWQLNRFHGYSLEELKRLREGEGYDLKDVLKNRLRILQGKPPRPLFPRYAPQRPSNQDL